MNEPTLAQLVETKRQLEFTLDVLRKQVDKSIAMLEQPVDVSDLDEWFARVEVLFPGCAIEENCGHEIVVYTGMEFIRDDEGNAIAVEQSRVEQ